MATSVRQEAQRRVPFWGIIVVAVLTVAALAAGVLAVIDDAPPADRPAPSSQQGQAATGAVTNLDALPASSEFVPRELGSSVGDMRVTGWVDGDAAIDPGQATSTDPATIGSFPADIAGSSRVDVATQLTGTGCTPDATPAVARFQLVDGAAIVASAQVSLPQAATVGALASTSIAVPPASAGRPLTVRVLLDNCTTGTSGDGFAVRVAATRLAA